MKPSASSSNSCSAPTFIILTPKAHSLTAAVLPHPHLTADQQQQQERERVGEWGEAKKKSRISIFADTTLDLLPQATMAAAAAASASIESIY
jgi:uncharacterized protein YabN with tetrapyrrole methylase and pyrophosphatase domain